VVFLDPDGGILFEVFVARRPDGTLHREQLAAFKALREAVVAEHIDDE
jgi:putative heme iron utilization protein